MLPVDHPAALLLMVRSTAGMERSASSLILRSSASISALFAAAAAGRWFYFCRTVLRRLFRLRRLRPLLFRRRFRFASSFHRFSELVEYEGNGCDDGRHDNRIVEQDIKQ
ncbi:hypothetical protein PO124_17415 [Bacillus licheniformis]|nr:hypothetical protein [Bacillus licheniformis]